MAVPVGDSLPTGYREEGGGLCDPEGTRNHR